MRVFVFQLTYCRVWCSSELRGNDWPKVTKLTSMPKGGLEPEYSNSYFSTLTTVLHWWEISYSRLNLCKVELLFVGDWSGFILVPILTLSCLTWKFEIWWWWRSSFICISCWKLWPGRTSASAGSGIVGFFGPECPDKCDLWSSHFMCRLLQHGLHQATFEANSETSPEKNGQFYFD